ncbi:MAG: domain S-box protein [Sphingobacteriales bacterium]|nr:domain S-box protein [Sphingobacteriales bacterium]
MDPISKELTSLGIEVLGDTEWGRHYCHFYETKHDLLDILIPFFKAGLENNEYCLWVTCAPLSVADAILHLHKAMPDFQHYIDENRIEILPGTAWYTKDGKFSKNYVVAAWLEKVNLVLARGMNGLRVNGNTAWLDINDWGNFIEYEEELNKIIAGTRIIVVCAYALKKIGAAEILDVARVHECVIAKRQGDWEIIEIPELKQTKAQIKKLNDELEKRVADRTSALEMVNKNLKEEIEEHKLTTETLNRSEQELRSLFAAMTDMVMILDARGQYNKIAPTKSSNLYKLSKGKQISDMLPEKYVSIVLEKIQQTLKTLEPAEIEYNLKVGDRIIWFEGQISPLTKDTVFWIARDITDSKMAELERTRIISDMAQHYKNLELFAQMVSHDLRGPVASILGIAEVMKSDSTTSEERIEIMEYLFRSVESLDSIIKDLNYTLEIKREIRETKETVYFSKLIEEIRSGLHNLLQKEGVQILTDFSSIDHLYTLKNYLFSIFYNLIVNSIKFKQSGKNTLVRIRSQIIGGKLFLSFKDNGRGIDLNRHADRIFKLYSRFHPDIEGKGMGLFIVKTQVETLGGSIIVNSTPGIGTEFIVEFPTEEHFSVAGAR